MHQILLNLANLHLITFCTQNNIDCSNTHTIKIPRKFIYALVNITNNKQIASITFHKSSTPTYSYIQ